MSSHTTCAAAATTAVDLTKVKPYGDTMNDGMIQLSFTLPVPYGEEANEAAKILAKKMGLDEPAVVFSKDMVGFTYFVMYGKCQHTVDYTTIKVTKVEVDVMDRLECEKYIAENIKRDVVIVGACSGTDAHTVGIDAIMNMKGFHGHFGLERYHGIEAINMGSQVPNEVSHEIAQELGYDAGFGAHTYAEDVASFVLTEIVKRKLI